MNFFKTCDIIFAYNIDKSNKLYIILLFRYCIIKIKWLSKEELDILYLGIK